VNYSYDALGRRVQRTSSTSGTTRFTYDGIDVVRDLDGSGATTADYLNGLGVDQKLRQTTSGTSSYVLADHLQTSRLLTDAAGLISFSVAYDSFGNITGGGAPTRYMFTGREHDSDTGMMYYRARWYDPNQGRFNSEDPIGLNGGINMHTYVQNSPIKFGDPLGLQSCCNKTWTDCYAQCIENNRFDNLLPLAFSALPKRFLPPFRVVNPNQPLTTIPSVIAHYLPKGSIASGLRTAGRFASRIATPILVFEGFYDLGLLGSCAELCHRNPCN
jgi:RHS repeat-associated protein